MKKKTKVILGVVIAVALIAAAIVGVVSHTISKNAEQVGIAKLDVRRPIVSDDPNLLNVALYPYVPDVGFMEEKCAEMFAGIAPGVKLNFVDWDCYSTNDVSNIDVFMYDSLFLDELYEQGSLQKLDLADFSNTDGLMDFILDDTAFDENGEKAYYAIPDMICSTFLIYKADDQEMAAVENIDDLYQLIGDVEHNGGSMKTDCLVTKFIDSYPYYYVDSLLDDKDPDIQDLAKHKDEILPNGTEHLSQIARMSGKEQVEQSDFDFWMEGEFGKAEVFGKGYGRALFDYSEGMSSCQDHIDDIDLKLISLGSGENETFFYTDLLSINSSVTDPKKFENCQKLLDLLQSEEYIYQIGCGEGYPSYLLPARDNCYDRLAKQYPMYAEIDRELDQADKHVARYGTWFRDYINNLYDVLYDYITY